MPSVATWRDRHDDKNRWPEQIFQNWIENCRNWFPLARPTKKFVDKLFVQKSPTIFWISNISLTPSPSPNRVSWVSEGKKDHFFLWQVQLRKRIFSVSFETFFSWAPREGKKLAATKTSAHSKCNKVGISRRQPEKRLTVTPFGQSWAGWGQAAHQPQLSRNEHAYVSIFLLLLYMVTPCRQSTVNLRLIFAVGSKKCGSSMEVLWRLG